MKMAKLNLKEKKLMCQISLEYGVNLYSVLMRVFRLGNEQSVLSVIYLVAFETLFL